VASTVLIASPEHLSALKDREDFGEALVFSDTEALRALDVITRQRPDVVALERMFAATSRGTALINRIKADPSLSSCEIRIVAHDTGYTRVSPRRSGDTTVGTTTPPAAAVAVAEAPRPAVAPLDQRGTRRAPRFRMVDGVDVQVDGNPAALVDLSVVGAQVVSTTILKPNQRIRLTLPNGPPPLRVSAAVAWASFEIPKGGARYRAGIEFLDADPSALTRFIDGNKK
jgi:CheY-like chemotaxis protein